MTDAQSVPLYALIANAPKDAEPIYYIQRSWRQVRQGPPRDVPNQARKPADAPRQYEPDSVCRSMDECRELQQAAYLRGLTDAPRV